MQYAATNRRRRKITGARRSGVFLARKSRDHRVAADAECRRAAAVTE